MIFVKRLPVRGQDDLFVTKVAINHRQILIAIPAVDRALPGLTDTFHHRYLACQTKVKTVGIGPHRPETR
jgi:hypothetical protein